MNISQIITRRQAIAAATAAGAAYVVAPGFGGLLSPETAVAGSICAQLTPELTEGPYWVNTMLRRSDVRANSNGYGHQPGVRLTLTINVLDSSRDCKPLNGVAVDIWHANAHGVYSDESSQQAGGGTSSSAGDTISDNWLRGYQLTGKDRGGAHKPVNGQVSFKTIWPGWYTGRAIQLSTSGVTIAGYTTQIFFSDIDNDRVLTGAAPYNTRSPQKDPTTDETDTVLSGTDDATNIIAVKGNIANGFSGTFNIALDNTEVNTLGSLSRPNTGAPSNGPGS